MIRNACITRLTNWPCSVPHPLLSAYTAWQYIKGVIRCMSVSQYVYQCIQRACATVEANKYIKVAISAQRHFKLRSKRLPPKLCTAEEGSKWCHPHPTVHQIKADGNSTSPRPLKFLYNRTMPASNDIGAVSLGACSSVRSWP